MVGELRRPGLDIVIVRKTGENMTFDAFNYDESKVRAVDKYGHEHWFELVDIFFAKQKPQFGVIQGGLQA